MVRLRSHRSDGGRRERLTKRNGATDPPAAPPETKKPTTQVASRTVSGGIQGVWRRSPAGIASMLSYDFEDDTNEIRDRLRERAEDVVEHFRGCRANRGGSRRELRWG